MILGTGRLEYVYALLCVDVQRIATSLRPQVVVLDSQGNASWTAAFQMLLQAFKYLCHLVVPKEAMQKALWI